MNAQAELLDLETALWTGGADLYRRTLSADALLVVPHDILDKERTVEAIAGSDRWESCEFEDVRVVELGTDAAVVAYRASARRAGGEPYRALVTSTYTRTGGRWLLAVHHQTPMP